MSTSFIVQASNPRSTPSRDDDDQSLSDAVQTVFPIATESLIIAWNNIYIPVRYKYDFSFMIDDILQICSDLLTTDTGTRTVHWPSNTFAAIWNINWLNNDVTIESKWHRVNGHTEALLTEQPRIALAREEFLCEWKRPLEIVNDALRNAGYTTEQIPRLAALSNLKNVLPRYGQLYE